MKLEPKTAKEYYKEARELVITEQKGSTSFLQRKLCINYLKACELIDMLEKDGVLGKQKLPKPRDVLIKS